MASPWLLRSVTNKNRRLGGTYRFHHQGDENQCTMDKVIRN
jgi:hypothetical protein